MLLLGYNKELRRTFKSIVQSFQQIVQLFLFFTLMTLFWAVIGFRIIGDLDGEVVFDEYS